MDSLGSDERDHMGQIPLSTTTHMMDEQHPTHAMGRRRQRLLLTVDWASLFFPQKRKSSLVSWGPLQHTQVHCLPFFHTRLCCSMLVSKSVPSRRRLVDKLQGSCLCKAITWELVNVYIAQLCICHCGSCQRHSGSSFLPFAAVERERLWPLLQDQATLRSYQSSSIATRYFCGTCASPIVHDYHEEQYTLWIPMGSLVMSHHNGTDWDWNAFLDPSRDSHIFCNDPSSFQETNRVSLPHCSNFGLYKHDPCQPKKEWDDIPTWEESKVELVVEKDPENGDPGRDIVEEDVNGTKDQEA